MQQKLIIQFKNTEAYEYKYELHQKNEVEYSAMSEKEMDKMIDKVNEVFEKFIKDDMFITIEIDIEAGTANVIPN